MNLLKEYRHLRRQTAEMATRTRTARTANQANQWQSVTWSPELGIFCAVAFLGTHRIMNSRGFS